MRFRRRLYRRGSSTETTIPKPLLFALDEPGRHDAIFEFDPASGRWYVRFEPREAPASAGGSGRGRAGPPGGRADPRSRGGGAHG